MILLKNPKEKVKLVKILLIFLFWLLPLGQLERIPLGIPGVGVYLHEIVIAGLVGFWAWDLASSKKKITLSALEKAILAILGSFVFSWAINIYRWKEESWFGFLYIVRWGMYACLYSVVKYYSKLDKKLLSFVKRGLLLAGFWFLIFGIIQYLVLPDLTWLFYFGWDDHYYRLTGTLLDPSYTGLFLAVLILYLLKEVKKRDFFYCLYLLLAITALLLTYSRSSYLAFLSGIFWLLHNKKSIWRSFLLGGLLLSFLLLAVLILPKPGGEGVNLARTTTIYSRIGSWRQSLIIFSKNPLFGIGFNNYRVASKEFGFLSEEGWRSHHAGAGVENSFLLILATSGVLGGASFLRLILLYVREKKKLYLILPIIVHSLFNNSLFYPWIMILWWLLL